MLATSPFVPPLPPRDAQWQPAWRAMFGERLKSIVAGLPEPAFQVWIASGKLLNIRFHIINRPEWIRRVLPAVRDVRRGGSAALDLCSVADGTADAYYEHVIQPWDIAAGALIAREAGAATIGGPGTALPNGILAAAPALAVALVELLAPSTLRRSV